MKFGTKSEVTFIDQESGSYRERTEKYRKGVVVSSQTTYCMRLRVSDRKEELAEFIKFRREKGDKVISFGIEYPKDYDGTWYYITKTFKD